MFVIPIRVQNYTFVSEYASFIASGAMKRAVCKDTGCFLSSPVLRNEKRKEKLRFKDKMDALKVYFINDSRYFQFVKLANSTLIHNFQQKSKEKNFLPAFFQIGRAHIGDVENERRKLANGVSYSCAPHRQFVIVLTLQVCYSRSVRKSYPIGLPLHVPGC
ncbi:hypothetical protein TNCT_30541 [Trichonephila clavata]|uniref:Uncharacterized protein n=1 Tax=Trichonephila clavata TaxID=2740835 RepID=A0A8X6HV70_TRICU|nr:hypothetical protein TNCT_30541 [Trichonephila clavata]